ncbi:MAG: SDR family oxidoreductase [Mycetocola sp.]
MVTGAASGIGAATTRMLLRAGACVVAGDVDASGLNALALPDDVDGRLDLAVADVRTAVHSEQLVDRAIERWGRVDSVIACAGIGRFGGILDVDADELAAMTEANFLGTVWLARAAVRRFREAKRGGDIVIVGSVAGMGFGGATEAVYAGTKAAQIQFGVSLQKEVQSEGIRVAVIAPAAVNTSFAVATGRFDGRDPEDGPFLQPDDVAEAIGSTLRQPRRMRTAVWTMWSLAE